MEYRLRRKKPHARARKSENGSLRGMLLRLFKAARSFQESISLQERPHVGTPRYIYYDHQKEIRTALSEVERKKAKALMESERQRMRMF